MSKINTSEHAKALGEVGATKGGRARAERLTSDERRAIAQQAAEARWGNDIPIVTHVGEIVIAERSISCAVLENGKRLLTQETFLKAIGRAGKAKGGTGSVRLATNLVEGLPPFLAAENLRPFISDQLRESTSPIVFRHPKGSKAYGYDARLLPMVCEVYLKARDARVILPAQQRIVEVCDLLMRGLAHVGIIALVDEATGYQEQRARDELSKILEAYISEELRPWTRMFPGEFFKQIYRLHGWEYKPGSAQRTPFIGKLINKYVYEQLPPGVLPELQRRNPVLENGRRRHKHHQFLTAETGNEHLDRQITAVTTILKVSDDKEQFELLFEKAFAKEIQHRLPLVIDVPKPRKGTRDGDDMNEDATGEKAGTQVELDL